MYDNVLLNSFVVYFYLGYAWNVKLFWIYRIIRVARHDSFEELSPTYHSWTSVKQTHFFF